MRRTVGNLDRFVRFVLAAGAVAGAGVLGFSSGWGVLLLVGAAVMVLTGSSAYCPAYSILHIDTLPKTEEHHQERGQVGTRPAA
ncbi:MAG: DUF2892 domain-containing protein [Actinomycetota bacterium]|nr:DUF2892 domain-containing protein [Actinomycetota bacterium]